VGSNDGIPYLWQTAEDIDGKERSMRDYKGKVLLITNVASQCGFTESNYRGLQRLYDKYRTRGFEVCILRHAAAS
jgi:glutathione peroxidase